MQASQSSVIWTIVIATAVLLVAGIVGYMAIPTADEVAAKVVVPTAAEIGAQIIVPQAPAVDTIKIDKVGSSVSKLCWLTPDCDGCRQADSKVNLVKTELTNREIKKAIKGITGLDTNDYSSFSAIEQLDGRYAIAENCEEGRKGNYAVEIVYRIVYTEIDAGVLDRNKVLYVSITANVVDGIDVENIIATQVDRDYEISKKPFV